MTNYSGGSLAVFPVLEKVGQLLQVDGETCLLLWLNGELGDKLIAKRPYMGYRQCFLNNLIS